MQLVAYGEQNKLYDNKKNYGLDLDEIEMIQSQNGQDLITDKIKYECDFGKYSDQFKIKGIIIEIDEDVEITNPIEDEISRMCLDIYACGTDENKNKIIEKINFIGSMPLIMGKITFISNSVVIKLPNIFFSSESKYFNNFIFYKFVLHTPIKFKKIFLENIVRYDDTIERRKIACLSSIFYELDYKYIGNDININNNKISNCLAFSNNKTIIFEKKILNSKEKVCGIYMAIPEQLVGLILYVVFQFKIYNKIIDLNMLETIYKIEEKGFVNLYKICFEHPLDLEPTDLVKIEFKYGDENEDDLNFILQQANNICVYPFVSNKLVCVNFNIKLKYSNGELNEKFNEKEKMIINKFSNNIDELSNAMCEFQKEQNAKQEQLKKDVDELFVNVKKMNVFREFIMRYIE